MALPSEQSVMIVDDEPDIRQLVSVMLRDHYTVLEANSGFQALKMLDQEFSSVTRRGRIVAVLSDIMMPGMDGLTLLRRIKAEFNLPVIMLTVKADSQNVMASLQSGADDFIVKPFVADLLLEKIARVTRR